MRYPGSNQMRQRRSCAANAERCELSPGRGDGDNKTVRVQCCGLQAQLRAAKDEMKDQVHKRPLAGGEPPVAIVTHEWRPLGGRQKELIRLLLNNRP